MMIQWRQRRSRAGSADRGIFFWSRVVVGAAVDVVVTSGTRRQRAIKALVRRRKRGC